MVNFKAEHAWQIFEIKCLFDKEDNIFNNFKNLNINVENSVYLVDVTVIDFYVKNSAFQISVGTIYLSRTQKSIY